MSFRNCQRLQLDLERCGGEVCGVDEVDDFAAVWQQAKPYIDEQRWQEVADLMAFQQQDARLWRDVCLEYFGQFAQK